MPRYRTYTLRIESEDGASLLPAEWWNMQRAISNAEDVVNDTLPDGFYCKIDESGEGVDLAAVRRLEAIASAPIPRDEGRDA